MTKLTNGSILCCVTALWLTLGCSLYESPPPYRGVDEPRSDMGRVEDADRDSSVIEESDSGEGQRLDAPVVEVRSTASGLHVAWQQVPGASSYELRWKTRVEGEWRDWTEVALTEFLDDEPSLSVDDLRVAASDALFRDHVLLKVLAIDIAPLPRFYEVRAIGQGGSRGPVGRTEGEPSQEGVQVQWQVDSSSDESSWVDIQGATSQEHMYVDAPHEGAAQTYRVRLTFGDEIIATSEGDEGRRLAAIDVDAGRLHTCAVTNDGLVRCWGDNDQGQLGLGDKMPRGFTPGQPLLPVPGVQDATQVCAGGSHSCAVNSSGALFCWGSNDDGQLGLGHTESVGDDGQDVIRASPVGGVVHEVTCGVSSTCARVDSGKVKCWGNNRSGSLLHHNTEETSGDEVEDLPIRYSYLDPFSSITDISSGAGHTCVITGTARSPAGE